MSARRFPVITNFWAGGSTPDARDVVVASSGEDARFTPGVSARSGWIRASRDLIRLGFGRGYGVRRTRIGPFAEEGSTGLPFCVISASPAATSRRAAMRAGSMSSRQCSTPRAPSCSPASATARAASLGQMVLPGPRSRRSRSVACSSWRSRSRTPARWHALEQNLTLSQSRRHFFRHSIRRPQRAHAFGSSPATCGG